MQDVVIDLLFKGIIAANPHPDKTRTTELRLSQARDALLGQRPRRGRKAYTDDVDCFPFFSEQLKSKNDQIMRSVKSRQSPEVQLEWEKEIARPVKSSRKSALEIAGGLQRENVTISSTADRIRTQDAAPFTTSYMALLEGLHHNDSPQAQALQTAFESLERLGIGFTNPLGRNTSISS